MEPRAAYSLGSTITEEHNVSVVSSSSSKTVFLNPYLWAMEFSISLNSSTKNLNLGSNFK